MCGEGDVQFTEDSTFASKYQRNNKRGGLKNLRCFPSCGPVHKARGFCGTSVNATIKCARMSPERLLIGFAEFVPLISKERFKKGSKVSKHDLYELERSSEHPLRPLIKGDTCQLEDGYLFEFNRRRKGWHYGWTANKHSCDTKHCLQIYVMEPLDCGSFECVSVTKSTPFVLFCRRRHRFQVKEATVPATIPKLAVTTNVKVPEDVGTTLLKMMNKKRSRPDDLIEMISLMTRTKWQSTWQDTIPSRQIQIKKEKLALVQSDSDSDEGTVAMDSYYQSLFPPSSPNGSQIIKEQSKSELHELANCLVNFSTKARLA